MKGRLLQQVIVIIAAMLLAAPVGAYYRALATTYAEMFETVAGPMAGKNLHLMNAEKFVAAVRKGEKITAVDIRTPGETRFFTANLPGHKSIPLAELFQRHNLDSLPEDGKIVILCKSGTRASAAVAALRHVGFENAYVLKGGFKALASYLGPKEAYEPMGPGTAAR